MVRKYHIARACGARKWLACVGLAALVGVLVWAVLGYLRVSPTPWLAGGTAVVIVALFYFCDRSKHVRFAIEESNLEISGDVFGRKFPLDTLRLERADVVDLRKEKEYQPRWKIIGTNLPGYKAGEFSLRNGKSAHVFLSDLSRVLCIPLVDGRLVLLSCAEAEELLAALRVVEAA